MNVRYSKKDFVFRNQWIVDVLHDPKYKDGRQGRRVHICKKGDKIRVIAWCKGSPDVYVKFKDIVNFWSITKLEDLTTVDPPT